MQRREMKRNFDCTIDEQLHQNGFSNGLSNGHTASTNGSSTPSKKQMVANGVSNGTLNGSTHGMSNGNSNGMSNGSTNGMSKGSTNGMSNGSTNGMSNGSSNGMSNGSSKYTNGATNGKAMNGSTNGIHSEATNGVANGYTNGVDSTSPYKFMESLIPVMLKNGFEDAISRDKKVVEFRTPEELKKILTFLPIQREGASDEELLAASKEIIKYSVKTSHPRFFNQLYGGLDEYSLAGCWLTEVLNASLYTYEVAPVFTLMEREIYRMMLDYIGFTNGDGIFSPGGSISNLYAINAARFHQFPVVKTGGIHAIGKRLCIFTSEKCHYSIKKAASVLGIGMDNVIEVKADKQGKMIPADLEMKIQDALAKGWAPFFVNATAGTTVMGAYDPIAEIADVTEKYKLWLHVDGAWGGSVAISKKYRHLVKGIERADSMTWNPHKMLGVPQQCSAILFKQKGLLGQCLSANALYLFQQDKFYDTSYDTGDMSLQCGRKVDVLKFWMMWKNKGLDKMERDVDHLFACSEYLAKKIKTMPGFRLLAEPECTNVCFWYIPPSIRGDEETPEWWGKVSKVAPAVKEGMMRNGSMMITYNPDGDHVNFFRMILSNFDSDFRDMDFVLEEITRLGEKL